MSFAAVYMAAAEFANGQCPIEAGVLGNLTDNECAHEFLPGDPVRWCSCWPNPPASPPAPAPLITTEEVTQIMEPVSTREARAAEREEAEAPFGRKADGSPRKRPAPSAEQQAKAQAGRQARRRRRQAEPVISRSDSDALTRHVTELEAHAARLRDELARTDARLRDELARTDARLRDELARTEAAIAALRA